MGSICIKISPSKVINANADIRYLIPDKMEELTDGRIKDNAYDYDDQHNMLIYLECDNPKQDVLTVIEILKDHTFEGDSFYGIAELFLSTSSDMGLQEPGSGYFPYPYASS